ncbi:hypothetical protein [Thalassotalea ganghwensis]
MMKHLFSALLVVFSFHGSVNANINYLNVEANKVTFSLTENKTHSMPSCAITETNQQYGVSLLTESGRAMYSLLITAMSTKQAVSVVSANDCADVDGVERALSVSVEPVIEPDDIAVVEGIKFVGFGYHYKDTRSPYTSHRCTVQLTKKSPNNIDYMFQQATSSKDCGCQEGAKLLFQNYGNSDAWGKQTYYACIIE